MTQQLALDVVGQNVANVNTPGYTRQIPQMIARDPAPYEGLILGRGVNIETIARNVDVFLEARLRDQETKLTTMKEKELYFSALEVLFNENSSGSLSSQLSDFWNGWHDVANNPSGMTERGILYERGALIGQTFNRLSEDLSRMRQELDLALEAGVKEVNSLVSKIAQLSGEIISLKGVGNPNDLMDQRSVLVGRLAEYLDIRSYEQEDGSLTLTTGRGYTLVSRAESYSLSYQQGRVLWESSGSTSRDITDTVAGGKIGAWLDMRDVVLPQYADEMNALARSIVWEVNALHSQGAGLSGFSSLAGTYAATDPAQALGSRDSGLEFYERIVDGSFRLWVFDANGIPVDPAGATFTVDPETTSLHDLSAAIGAVHPNVSAAVVDGRLSIAAEGGCTFVLSDDTSHVLAALGLNTFFQGTRAEDMGMNPTLEADQGLIAAARIGAAGTIAKGNNENALRMLELPDQKVPLTKYVYHRGSTVPTEQPVTITLENYLYQFLGSVGVESQSIARSREYHETIVTQLTETRDGISAVSIDEEMTNLIKYQKAYAAAAKLLSAADEMYQSLIEAK
jgi:flagellar hook-associated protein 1 FlgK